VKRRAFITLLGGAAAAWPLVAGAQQARMPVIGWLSGISSGIGQPQLAAFRKALADAGFIEDRNFRIEYLWAEGKFDQLPSMAADLVARRVSLIVSGGGERAVLAAKAATSTIPIVMVVGGDPVKTGLVASLNRPSGNITGATLFAQEMESKRLGLLLEAVPAAKAIAALFNPGNQYVELQMRDVRQVAERAGVELVILNASTESEFEGVFATMTQRKAGGLLVGSYPN
jgi:putative ABC transport system substrate-binding protein